jgi:hypothetical protein
MLLSKATVNYLKNENTVLTKIKSVLKPDSLNKDVTGSYDNLMAQADRLKDFISKGISGVDYQTYLNDDEHISPAFLMPAQLNESAERQDFIEAVINFESKANTKIYDYEAAMGYNAPNRNAEIDYALMEQPHVKDLMSFIVNLQTRATLALVKQ